MVNSLPEKRYVFADEAKYSKTKNTKKPRRVALTDRASVTVTVTLPIVVACYELSQAVLKKPSAAATKRLAERIADAMKQRFGDSIDDGKLEVRTRAVGYRITFPDDRVETVTTLDEAATLMSMRKQSLSVLLTRGRGKYSRHATHDDRPSRISCERLA